MAIKASAQITLSSVRDVAGTWRYYKLQASTLAAPAKPTTNPPSGWTLTEPTYTEGSTTTLYMVELNKYSDGTFAYSEVSVSASFEAAKLAYNKAQAALGQVTTVIQRFTTAGIDVDNDAGAITALVQKIDKAQTTADGVQVGGRNLLLNSLAARSGAGYLAAEYVPSEPMVSGETYTLSAEVTPATGVTNIRAYTSGGNADVVNGVIVSDCFDNACPKLDQWTLSKGAYIDDEGFIVLPDATSAASVDVPWRTNDTRIVNISFDAQNMSTENNTFVMSTQYLASNGSTLSGNGRAAGLKSEVSNYNISLGNTANATYGDAIFAAATIRITIFRSATYGKYPYRFKNVYVPVPGKQTIKQTFTARYLAGMTPEDDLKNANLCFFRLPNDGTVTGATKIERVKLEKGNRATDWTPAPEDVDSDISAAASLANTALSRVTTAESRLEQTEESIRGTVKKTDLLTVVDGLATKESLQSMQTQTTQNASELAAAVSRISQTEDGLETYIKRMIFDLSGLHLRAGDDVKTELNLTEDQILFKDALGNVCATIAQKLMTIENVQIGQTMQIGGGVWRVLGDGSIGLFKK